MNQRQENLLQFITTEFIKTAQPVSSKFITEAGDFSLSAATIRNEMADLEKQGFIYHPHTSAGRVPTEKGYQFYIDNFLEAEKVSLPKKDKELLEKTMASYKGFEAIAVKELAKQMAELSDAAVFVAFAKNDFYYTGLSNLFSQPEFLEHQLVYQLSSVIDHLDTSIKVIFDNIGNDINVSLGNSNPFSRHCGSVLTSYENGNNHGILGILGPVRMDYENNFGLVKYSQELIEKMN